MMTSTRTRRTSGGVSPLHDRMIQGDPEALAIYHKYQDGRIGPDPMAEGAQDWPSWDDWPTTVPVIGALHGWRMWAVVDTTDGPRLCAPFITGVNHATPDTPGVAWAPGINRNSTYGCKRSDRGVHPHVKCRCGIRAVQSLTVLRAFAADQEPRIGPLVAYAEVKVWGRVAPFAPDDDWRYTLRAEFAQIAGPLHLASTHAMHAEALAKHYGIEIKTYKLPDLSNVSALVILKAADELSKLGLRTTWDDLVALLRRTEQKEPGFTATEKVWLSVLKVWMTLNASGVECSLSEAMGKVEAI